MPVPQLEPEVGYNFVFFKKTVTVTLQNNFLTPNNKTVKLYYF